jgi:asparagine N-glycosylation enzyme membrane subunit Stt3
MVINSLKLVGAAALVLISSGAWPNPRYGLPIAIGLCIVAAVILHFVAP